MDTQAHDAAAKAPRIINLDDYEQQDVGSYELILPDGSKSGVLFQLAGPTHPVREAYEKKNLRRGLRQFNKHGKSQLPDDPDELLEQTVERLCAYTLGWTDNLAMDGALAPFSEANRKRLYTHPKLHWIRDQINVAVGDLQLFMSSSAQS